MPCVCGGGKEVHGKHACSVVLPGRSYGEEGESLFVREITGEGEGFKDRVRIRMSCDTRGHRRLHDPLQCHGSSITKGKDSCMGEARDT